MKRKIFFTFFVFLSLSIFAEKTKIDGLHRKTLKNGMEIFVMENHSAPLAYIEIAMRCGAVTQNADTAGLFHLYEHLMFKGNKKYPNQKAFTQAMNSLGVSDWNGTTGVDRVNYFFTVPSSAVNEGIEFWSYAIRTPLLNEDELEREKKVVLSEINGDFTQPARIRSASVVRAMYPESPWRLDPSGNPSVVENATVEQMKKIQSEYYVPENAALLVGGDVDAEEIFKTAEKIFGDWKRAKTEQTFEEPPKKFPKGEPIRLVFADPSSSDDFVSANYILRGPNGETDKTDTYAADIWVNCIAEPNGIFENTFTQNEKLAIPDPDYISGGYYTRRAAGQISIGATMLNDSSLSSVARAEEFYKTIRTSLVDAMTSADFPNDIKSVEKRLSDSRIYEMETAEGVLSSLSFFFTAVDADYFFDYEEKLLQVKNEEVRDFVKKYIEDASGILLVSVSENEFNKRKDEFESAGYKKISADSAFWWNEGANK